MIYQNHVLSFPIYLGDDKEVIIWEMMNEEIKVLFEKNNTSIYEILEQQGVEMINESNMTNSKEKSEQFSKVNKDESEKVIKTHHAEKSFVFGIY